MTNRLGAEDRRSAGPVVCLAASGGGHLRQLLDLERFWSRHEHFFVTEDTAMGRSVAARHPTEYVPHFALGQARLGNPFLMLKRAGISAWRSLAIVWHRRPTVVVTTGAGSQLFVVLWARLLGARIVLIDSFARFEGPSAFARLAGPLAHLRIAQSAAAAAHWPGAIVYDPLVEADRVTLPKKDLLVATVGATLSFPRLVGLVLEAKRAGIIMEKVVLQVAEGAETVAPVPGVKIVDSLSFDDLQAALAEARLVISHGGTGSIITALQAQCGTVVIPRRFALGEHYDDHQAEISAAFAERGLVQVADDAQGLATALKRARSQPARPVRTDYTGVVELLEAFAAER